jgi:hypothetical protein
VLDEKEAALRGLDSLQRATLSTTNVKLTICYSCNFPEGQVGCTHTDYMARISRHSFDQASFRGWPYDDWFLSSILLKRAPTLLDPEYSNQQPGFHP